MIPSSDPEVLQYSKNLYNIWVISTVLVALLSNKQEPSSCTYELFGDTTLTGGEKLEPKNQRS